MRRLYLDTADLIDIGDGRVSSQAAALRLEMDRTYTVLVVSREHVQDAYQGDAASIERFVRAVESFPSVHVIVRDPNEVEPLAADNVDIVVESCRNFRELVFADATRKALERINAFTDNVHAAQRAGHDLMEPSVSPSSLRSEACFFHAYAMMLSSHTVGDNPDLLKSSEQRLRITLSQGEREKILGHLKVARAVASKLASLAEADGVDMTTILWQTRKWYNSPTTWPGHSLALHVSGARWREARRKPRRSDGADLGHVMNLPYVDIATCDAETLAKVQRALPHVPCPRRTKLFKNRSLGAVTETISMLR